jgi:nucleotide-binding universal stress UspA family protein
MRVLLALDQSAISVRAAREAHRLFAGAEFLVVNVSRLSVPWLMGDEFGAVYPATLESLPSEGIEEDELTALAADVGIDDPEIVIFEGDPASAICRAAEDHDVDVVVVGSHDKGVLRRLFEPSVAQAVVQGTYRPVLVVSGTPPPSE